MLIGPTRAANALAGLRAAFSEAVRRGGREAGGAGPGGEKHVMHGHSRMNSRMGGAY